MPSLRLPRRRGSSHRPRNTKRRNAIVASVIGVIAFVSALVLWSGGGSDDSSVALPKPDPTSAVATASGSASSSVPVGASPTPTATTGSALGLSSLPDLPGTSSNVDPAALPPHTTVVTVTSDSPILRFGYKTAYGSSSKGIRYLVKSPATVRTGTRGYGAQAVVGAQAGPYGTFVTCTISVDGKTRVTRSVKGAYQLVVCVG